MVKIIRAIFVVSIFVSVACDVSYAADNVNIMEYFENQYITRIFVNDIKNSTGNEEVDLILLKESVENAFLERVSQDFEVAVTSETADVTIDMNITEYLWTEDDPVDNLLGIGGVAIDAAKQENYARMIAEFKFTDVKSGEVLWEDTLKATITDDEMSEGDSYGMINDRIVKVLTRNLFSRHKARSR